MKSYNLIIKNGGEDAKGETDGVGQNFEPKPHGSIHVLSSDALNCVVAYSPQGDTLPEGGVHEKGDVFITTRRNKTKGAEKIPFKLKRETDKFTCDCSSNFLVIGGPTELVVFSTSRSPEPGVWLVFAKMFGQ